MQLETFKAWAGRSSDISYYLNSHHVDFSEWVLAGRARPLQVVAAGSTGVCKRVLDVDAEDTISLLVTWENLPSGTTGVASYTASWAAPKSDVHSQQRFHFMSHGGEVTVDQAHRGYSVATDADGYGSANVSRCWVSFFLTCLSVCVGVCALCLHAWVCVGVCVCAHLRHALSSVVFVCPRPFSSRCS